MEEGAPRRRDWEDEAGDEEGGDRQDQDRADGRATRLPRQSEQADKRDRKADHEEDREQVVPDPGRSKLEEPGWAGREITGQGRRVVPGEDVEPVEAQRVGGGLPRERTP